MNKELKLALRAFLMLVALTFGTGAYAQFNLKLNLNTQLSPNLNTQLNLNLVNVLTAQGCMSNAEIQQAVASGRILPLSTAMRNAGIGGNSKVLPPVAVCNNNGVLFYQFSILDNSGKATRLVLPATGPSS